MRVNMRLAVPALTVVLSACGFDSDRPWEPDPHACLVSLNRDWTAYVKSMRVQHQDPRRCPIPVEFGEIGNPTHFAGSVIDDNGDDVVRDQLLEVNVKNGCGRSVRHAAFPFRENGGDHVANYSTDYPVATGLNDYCGSEDDIAHVSTELADLPEVVFAYVNLEVLYGTRSTQMLSPDRYAATPFVLPPDSYCAAYSAQSTLDNVVRTGVTHRWYVDGEDRGGGDNPSLYLVLPEGWHTLRVDGTDQYGYSTTSGDMWFEVSASAAGCP